MRGREELFFSFIIDLVCSALADLFYLLLFFRSFVAVVFRE